MCKRIFKGNIIKNRISKMRLQMIIFLIASYTRIKNENDKIKFLCYTEIFL